MSEDPNRQTNAVIDTQVRLCGVEEIPPGTVRSFDVADRRIAVVRIGNDFYAIGDRCSHENVSLSEGAVDSEDCQIECWKHGSAFSLVSGEAQSLPATKPVPVYQIVVSDGDVMMALP